MIMTTVTAPARPPPEIPPDPVGPYAPGFLPRMYHVLPCDSPGSTLNSTLRPQPRPTPIPTTEYPLGSRFSRRPVSFKRSPLRAGIAAAALILPALAPVAATAASVAPSVFVP